MIVLHFAPINMKTSNGFRFSVPGLVSAQNKIMNVTAGLVNVGKRENLIEEEIKNYDFEFLDFTENILRLKVPFNCPDIVIFHGVYNIKYIKIYKQLLRKSIPYIIVPRVSLTIGAQQQKWLKKQLGNLLLFNKFIKNAKMIHFLTENEMKLSKKFLGNYFVIPNGIHIPDEYKKSIGSNLNLTYMSRYDIHHKGLDILLKAIIKIQNILVNERVTINFYGSDFHGGKKYLETKVKEYSVENVIKINDAIFGNRKSEVLKNTDIFILTSRFEGHPMAVIEAMSYGIPCILTSGTNMVDILRRYDAGWETKLDSESIAETIIKAISEKNEILKKGINARKLAIENYNWNVIAQNTVKHYHNILNTMQKKD